VDKSEVDADLRQSANSFDDPKVETIAELFRRHIGGALGIVSTAFIADATPAALCAHTRDRKFYNISPFH